MPSFFERATGSTTPESPPLAVFRPQVEECLSRVPVEVLTTSGSNARVEFKVRRDTVELWHREHLAAAFDRELLGEWLHGPDADLVVDEARLSVDWQVDVMGRVALTLPDVNAWALSPADLDALYRRVVTDQEESR